MKRILFTLTVFCVGQILFAQSTDIKEIANSNGFTYLKKFDYLSKDTFMLLAVKDSIYYETYSTINSGVAWKKLIKTEPTITERFFFSTREWITFKGGTIANYTSDSGNTLNDVLLPGNYQSVYKYNDWLFLNTTKNQTNTTSISSDNGTTWNEFTKYFNVLKPLFITDSILVVSGNRSLEDYDYWHSDDFGKTWTGICETPRDSRGLSRPLTYISIDTAYYVVNDYSDYTITIYWSFDGGKTIHTQYSTSFGSTENVGNIKMANSKIGYRNSGNKLYKTYNGGQTWYYKYTFECPVSNIEVIDQNHVYFHFIGGSQSVNKCIYVTHNGAEPLVETQETPNKNDFTIYPNPANQSITLSTPNGANAALSIYNLMGQIQYQNPAQAPSTIDISHLATGLYIFELRQGAVVHRQRIEVVK